MKTQKTPEIKHDYKARILKLQQFMKTNNLDAFIVSTQDSIYYLSGASYMPIERPFFIIVRQQGSPELVVPNLEFEHMKQFEGFGDISSYFEYPSIKGENWYDKLNAMLGEKAVLGIEPEFSTAKAKLLKVREVVISPAITEMRVVKTPDEIEAIRLASAWTDKGMYLVHHGLYRGQTVIEANMPAKTLQTGVISSGEFDYFNCSFLTAGWPAPKSSQPHSLPDLHMQMGSGPIVLMSYNRVNGYAAECERTVFLGRPTAQERSLYEIVMEARAIAYGMVKPGVRCSDIDVATQEFFKAKGYGDKFIHRTGHGIGMGNHEQPWLSSGSTDVLAENMVISIEPALYFAEIGGFRHSDTVLVTSTGYERLTKYPDDLESLIITERRRFLQLKGKIVRKAINY
jgi:Xaa-Pro aminopeptidase